MLTSLIDFTLHFYTKTNPYPLILHSPLPHNCPCFLNISAKADIVDLQHLPMEEDLGNGQRP